jgi:Lon protease-like protein
MIKRCLDTSKTFGLVLPAKNNLTGNPSVEFGTLMYIKEFIPIISDVISTIDGNLPGYLIECDGMMRFKIMSYTMNSGGFYDARIKMVHDIEPEDQVPIWNPNIVSNLFKKVRSVVNDKISILPPSVKFHFESQFGSIPNNPNELSFWIAQFIPVDSYVLYQLLEMTQVDQRLELVCQWLEKFSVAKSQLCL